jgi:hypothetical protein
VTWRRRGALALFACSSIACARPTTSAPASADAATPRTITVRVPSALRIARAIDALSVEIDPASLSSTEIAPRDGMILGVESDVSVFAQGTPRPASSQRHGYSSSTAFDLGTDIWSTKQDGIPLADKKYVVEMQLVLFETDVPVGHEWDPHAGAYRALWTRTITQAEE